MRRRKSWDECALDGIAIALVVASWTIAVCAVAAAAVIVALVWKLVSL